MKKLANFTQHIKKFTISTTFQEFSGVIPTRRQVDVYSIFVRGKENILSCISIDLVTGMHSYILHGTSFIFFYFLNCIVSSRLTEILPGLTRVHSSLLSPFSTPLLFSVASLPNITFRLYFLSLQLKLAQLYYRTTSIAVLAVHIRAKP